MARNNIRKPNDHRPLPQGIGPIPPPARPRTRSSSRSAPQEVEPQPAIIARTNTRHPNDRSPLPRGIGAIPPPKRPCTRASTQASTLASIQASIQTSTRASTRPAPQPKPPTITPMPPRRPTQAEQLAALNYQLAEADSLFETSLAHVRDNMAVYEARYPCAVQVRTRLGAAAWEQLELKRCSFAGLAYEIRKLDRQEDRFPRRVLDNHVPKMKEYIREACGECMEAIFDNYHETLEERLEEAEVMGLGILDGKVMTDIREMFHHQPFMWCIYNQFFPIKGRWGNAGRMRWEQLHDWVIWTLRNPMEVPSWFRWMRWEDRVPLKQVSLGDIIWKAALVEAFEDVGARMERN